MTKTSRKTLPNPNDVFCPSNIPMRRAVLAHIDALRADRHGSFVDGDKTKATSVLSPNLIPLRRAVMAHMQNFRQSRTA